MPEIKGFSKYLPRLAERAKNNEIYMSTTDIFDTMINGKYVFQLYRFNAFIDYLKQNDNQTLELLLNDTGDYGINLICTGIFDGKDPAYIKALLDITRPNKTEKYFDVNAVQYGKTALHYAIYKFNTSRINSDEAQGDMENMENMKEIIKILIEAGADLMVKDSNGNTPIEFACMNGDTEIVELLKPKYSADNLKTLKFDVNTTCSNIVRRTASKIKRFGSRMHQRFFKGKSTLADSTSVNGGSKRKRKTKKSRRVKSMKKRK
jgi:ankyrin repeat protein